MAAVTNPILDEKKFEQLIFRPANSPETVLMKPSSKINGMFKPIANVNRRLGVHHWPGPA